MKRISIAVSVLLMAAMLNSCSKSSTSTPAPTVPVPVADFSFTGNGVAPSTVTFSNTSAPISSGLTYFWDFGDGGTSTLASPAHTYTQGGTYNVKLTASNSGGVNTLTKQVTILTPVMAKITGLKIVAMPFTNTSGGNWDLTSGPDVYYTFNGAAGGLLLQGPTVSNMLSSQIPYLWGIPSPLTITSTLFASQYSVSLWDDDSPASAELIGGYYFRMSDYASAGYPTTILLQNPTTPAFKLELTLQWQ